MAALSEEITGKSLATFAVNKFNKKKKKKNVNLGVLQGLRLAVVGVLLFRQC